MDFNFSFSDRDMSPGFLLSVLPVVSCDLFFKVSFTRRLLHLEAEFSNFLKSHPGRLLSVLIGLVNNCISFLLVCGELEYDLFT